MENANYKTHIIGAGVSGLIAATVLEQKGFSPVIIQATGSIGGRVETDIVDGYQLDHGFKYYKSIKLIMIILRSYEALLFGKSQKTNVF